MAFDSVLVNSLMVLASSCALLGLKIAPLASAKTDPVRFVVLGDMPYSQHEAELLRGDLRQAIAEAQVPFVIHYGDFKPGNASCTDELFQQVKADFDQLHPRLMYTPGDNDWTDCDRAGLTEPQSELERLQALRQIFFQGNTEEGVTRQPNFPENARWWQAGVLFTTLHIVGTDNGRSQILKDDPAVAIAQVEERDAANQVWLQGSFDEAQSQNAQAMVIVIQADVTEPQGAIACTPANPMPCDAYFNFREQLTRSAAVFQAPDSTLKPVLLVHGDTFPFCLDSAFGGQTAPNLQRLNAWGDFQQPADVTAIEFQPQNQQHPFQIKTLMNQREPVSCSQE